MTYVLPKLKETQRTIPQIKSFLDDYSEVLSHGSGINCDWYIETNNKGDKIFCNNSYHLMDEHGFYDGWQDFRVIIFRHTSSRYTKLIGPMVGYHQCIQRVGDIDFRIQFVGGLAKRKSAFGLRDHLEEMFQYALSEAGILTPMDREPERIPG